MAIVTKTTLKTYFEQGDIPTQGQYVDLIDSNLNLGESETTQIIQGTISASAAIVGYVELKKMYIPGIGVGSATVGTTFIVGRSLEVIGDINTTGNISASGHLVVQNITASGNISASGYLVVQNITASGNISASGALIGNSLTLGGTAITSTAAEINYLDGVLSTVKNAYDGVTNVSQGNIRFTELDNGTEDLALTSLGTGDIPTFAGLNVGKTPKPSVGEYGGTLTVNLGGKAITFTIEDIPPIPAVNDGVISKPIPTFK
jgi:hypothetical protein